jgi:hypothetical protein
MRGEELLIGIPVGLGDSLDIVYSVQQGILWELEADMTS